jgi:hypothetical protein
MILARAAGLLDPIGALIVSAGPLGEPSGEVGFCFAEISASATTNFAKDNRAIVGKSKSDVTRQPRWLTTPARCVHADVLRIAEAKDMLT